MSVRTMPSNVADELQQRRNEAVALSHIPDRRHLLSHIAAEEEKWLGSDEAVEGKTIPYNTDNRAAQKEP